MPTFKPIGSPTRSLEDGPSNSMLQSPEEVFNPNLGLSTDVESCRLHHQYQVSFGKKRIPPDVCCILHLLCIAKKCNAYKKHMAKQNQKAVKLMLHTKIKVLATEALMLCPLSKFINFAANDCGYTESCHDFIAN